ncbi:MAG: MmcQ/YjbR family DNA-binding protein [Fimbriimonadaceae bacterium]
MSPEEILAQIRATCMALSEATEDNPWGHTAWKVGGKLFAIGGETGVTLKATLDEQAALILHPQIEKAAYVGRHGWVTVSIDEDTLGLALELISRSYELVAPKKLLKNKKL